MAAMASTRPATSELRERLHEIIFESDTFAGRAFDLTLIALILASVIAVMLDSVGWIRAAYGSRLAVLEWSLTIVFTIEYGLRVYCVRRRLGYITSFFGIVDLLSILPAYLSLVFADAHMLVLVRGLRLLRVFRVLKLGHYLGEANDLMLALRASRPKITVFLVTVMSIASIVGALMYLIEGESSGFDSIPAGVYWAIVTMTTVGYGDISPETALGRVLASVLMLLGYGIIAIPTGVVTSEIVRAGVDKARQKVSTQSCPGCSAQGHDVDAKHCKFCGEHL
jgi:voltage-gated potassium channel